MPLTNDQQKAADAFTDFLHSTDTFFTISGGAGVGKTFLMNHICHSVMPAYENQCQLMGVQSEYDTVAFTATTNKAAEVLENALGKPVDTIYSFLGLIPRTDYTTGKTSLVRKKHMMQTDISRTIIFIDEASMAGQVLFDYILDAAARTTKIVFVGDHAQMAPVDAEISPVFSAVDPGNLVHLTEPVRNADSPVLMDLCTQLRGTVETGDFMPIPHVPGVIDYLSGPQMEAEIQTHFVDQQLDARIMCYTNSRVKTFNAAIREMRGLPDKFTPGEELVSAQYYRRGEYSIAVERSVWIHRHLTEAPVESSLNSYADWTPDGQPLLFHEFMVSRINDPEYGFRIQVPAHQDHFDATLAKLKRKKKWAQYYQLIEGVADLRPKDACTVYKSQGSTYDTAFVDIGNIGICHDPKQVARMLFVAASRARKRVCLFGQLPAKYIGRNAA